MSTTLKSTSSFNFMTTKASKNKNNVFDIDKFLDSEAGKKYLQKALKSKILSKKEYLKRTEKLRKKYGLK